MNFEQLKETCPDLPWCQDDPEKLGNCISQFVEKHDSYLSGWTQKMYENFQYIYGNHKATWSKKWGFAVDVDFLRQSSPSMATHSQTNVTRTSFESLCSLIFGNAPDWDVQSADETSTQGRRFQKITEKLLICFYERLQMEKRIRSFVGVLTSYGFAGAKISFDRNAGRIMEIPEYEEISVPLYEVVPTSDPMGILKGVFNQTNESGENREEKRIVNKRNADGSIKTKTVQAGDTKFEVLTPFELRFDTAGFENAKWIEHVRVMDFDDYIAEFAEEDGRTKYFEMIRPGRLTEAANDFSIKQFLRMQFMTPIPGDEVRRRTSNAIKEDFLRHKVVVIEHYDKPNAERWPEGRRVIVVNGLCTHIQLKANYRTNKSDGWHPFVVASWLSLAPSPMPSSPLNDVTAKNKELDRLDSQIDMSSARNFGSAVLIKQQSGIDPDQFFNAPGQVFSVPNVNDAINYVRDSSPIPPNSSDLRQQKKDDIYEISGAQDAIRGNRSKGATSGYAQKVIEEREQARLTPVRKEVENAVAGAGQKIIACHKANAKELDKDVFAYIQRSAAGEFSTADVEAFLKNEIDYAVDINVTAGSMVAKSKASIQATLIELVQKTPAGQRLQDAEVLDNFLKFFDAQVLRDGTSVHRDRAIKENDIFSDVGKLGPEATGLQLPVVSWADDDDIHITYHRRDMAQKFNDLQTNEFELLVREFHIARHEMQSREKKGEVPAGSTHTFTETYVNAQNNKPSQLPEIQQKKQALDAAKSGQPAPQSPPGQMQGAPGAPGPGPQNPAAPAAQSQGGKMAATQDARIARDGG